MSSIVTERFIDCHKSLLEKGRIRSNRQMALSLDYLPQSLGEILKGRRDAPVELLRKFVEEYRANPCYLFLGEGEMFLADFGANMGEILQEEARIIHVSIPAQAGYGGQIHDQVYIEQLPKFSLPDQRFRRGNHRCFDVSGDSMEPYIQPRDMVVCSEVESSFWKTDVKDNLVYVIVTHSDIVVKRVRNLLDSESCLELISDNDFYEPYKVAGEDILEIWKVVMKISHFVPSARRKEVKVSKELTDLKQISQEQNDKIESLSMTIQKMLKQNRQRF